MNWYMASVGAVIIASSGCATESVPLGAQSIFARANTCSAERVTVTARPDVAPHTVLPPEGPDANAPPPEGGDYDVMRSVPRSLAPPSAPRNVDALGATYEVSGCGKSLLLVCANPIVDGRSGAFSASFSEGFAASRAPLQHSFSKAQIIEGDRVLSMVVCEPAVGR
jgi:hypothetical protein